MTYPVRVEARLLEYRPATEDYMASADFGIDVRDAAETVHLRTYVIAVSDLDEALRVLRSTIAWREPYLFVRLECGGGNAWSCCREVVFRVSRGKATRIGEFAVSDELQVPAMSYRSGYFVDTYDKLEDSVGGLPHLRAPSFDLFMLDVAGHLGAAPAQTWLRNQERYQTHEAEIDALLAAPMPDLAAEPGEIPPRDLYAATVANAVLAKYCGCDGELLALLTRVSSRLDDDEWKWLQQALAMVKPLELPDHWRSGRDEER